MVEAFRTPCVFMLVILVKIVIHVLSVSCISDTSTGTKPSFYTALWTRTKIYPKRPLKLCEYTSNGWSQSVSDHFPVTKRALSVKFFSFSQSKKNVHDENMNSLTLAGETSPPKSNDKRLVHTYLLMSVLLLIKSVFESKLLSSFIGWESTNKSPTENKMCKKLKLKICENYVSLQQGATYESRIPSWSLWEKLNILNLNMTGRNIFYSSIFIFSVRLLVTQSIKCGRIMSAWHIIRNVLYAIKVIWDYLPAVRQSREF